MIPLKELVKRHTLNILALDNASLSYRWQKLRKKYVKEKGGWCRVCGYTKHIEVHHIIPRHVSPILALDWYNLIVLCRSCHFSLGHLNNYSFYNPDIVKIADFMISHREKCG